MENGIKENDYITMKGELFNIPLPQLHTNRSIYPER